MSFASLRLPAGVFAAGPLLFVMIGCSGGAPADGTPQAAAAPAVTASKATATANKTSPAGAASFDRYANPTPATPATKPALDFDGDAFKSAVANQAVVGDRYSR